MLGSIGGEGGFAPRLDPDCLAERRRRLAGIEVELDDAAGAAPAKRPLDAPGPAAAEDVVDQHRLAALRHDREIVRADVAGCAVGAGQEVALADEARDESA